MACSNCAAGELTNATPTGTVTTLFSRPTYIANPPEGTIPKATILFLPDAFGWEFPNNRVLADSYAKRTGMRVLLPEFMDGNALPVWVIDNMAFVMSKKGIWNTLLKPFKIIPVLLAMIPFRRRNKFDIVMPRIHSFIKDLRASSDPLYASAPLGAAGFCWGAKPCFLLAGQSGAKPPLDAIFVGHPSFTVVPEDVQNIRVPTSVAVGDNDRAFPPKDVAATREIWESKEWAADGTKPSTELTVYDGATHGFCVRAELKYGQNVDAAGKAEDQAVKWFVEHLS